MRQVCAGHALSRCTRLAGVRASECAGRQAQGSHRHAGTGPAPTHSLARRSTANKIECRRVQNLLNSSLCCWVQPRSPQPRHDAPPQQQGSLDAGLPSSSAATTQQEQEQEQGRGREPGVCVCGRQHAGLLTMAALSCMESVVHAALAATGWQALALAASGMHLHAPLLRLSHALEPVAVVPTLPG